MPLIFLSHLSSLEISPFILRTFAGPMIKTKGVSINISFLETIFSSYEIFVSSREIFVSSREIFVSSYEIRTSYELFETSVGSEKSELRFDLSVFNLICWCC